MKITKVRPVKTPTRGTKLSAGLDFYVPADFDFLILHPSESVVIPSGIIASVPKGKALIAFNKSGISVNKRLQVGACVVDEDYQGEIHIHLVNVGNLSVIIEPGDKIIQFILLPVFYDIIEVVSSKKELFSLESERGAGWKGHTGTK